jgi:hypothetical protein
VIGSGSSGVVKKVLHKPTGQVRMRCSLRRHCDDDAGSHHLDHTRCRTTHTQSTHTSTPPTHAHTHPTRKHTTNPHTHTHTPRLRCTCSRSSPWTWATPRCGARCAARCVRSTARATRTSCPTTSPTLLRAR